jgi:hypothetical protein
MNSFYTVRFEILIVPHITVRVALTALWIAAAV